MALKKMYELRISRFFEKKENININVTKNVKERYVDLELGLGSKVEIYEKNGIMLKGGFQILENYVSFMEIVNYLSSPLEERDKHYNFSFVIKDKIDVNKLKDYKVEMVFPL